MGRPLDVRDRSNGVDVGHVLRAIADNERDSGMMGICAVRLTETACVLRQKGSSQLPGAS